MITWKITDTTSENGVITSAKYFADCQAVKEKYLK